MTTKHTIKMAELLIFFRSFAAGFLVAEVGRIAFYLGSNFAPTLSSLPNWARASAMLTGLAICLIYAAERGALASAGRIARSLRIDLLAAVGVGIWANELSLPWLIKVHAAVEAADPQWAPVILVLLCSILLSPLIQRHFPRSKKAIPQLYFIADEEIESDQDDLLANEGQAKAFAETVLESDAHSGLVFGVDGPWGIGKTSFINLAERYWALAKDRVIVCRFEPLRYASETDLADRMIRDISAAIQRQVFAPEFRPTASRYSRLIKGRADISFLGFKLSLEPGHETVEELLEDIDEALKRIGRRVIIVVDDLDRLDAKTTNSILFATRRTFKLSQATYVLCYDTEILTGTRDDDSRAREFLEKFVTVKMSLFVDSSKIRDFLLRDWKLQENKLSSIPADTMLKLGAVLHELAEILDGGLATNYLPVAGDLRKVKRLVNAMLLMQIERSELGRTDFNKKDLIHLILLHLNYPGLFRRIYAEETEGRSGIFSITREYGSKKYKNATELSNLTNEESGTSGFLLRQIFDAKTLNLDNAIDIDENFLKSRACFNEYPSRNLESYLKLIVRFITPEPSRTFALYQDAVNKVSKGTPIASILTSSEFKLNLGDYTHDQFWRILVNQSYNLEKPAAEDAINTLVDYIPHYSSIEYNDRGLRSRSIYSLLQLLDRAGRGRPRGRRHHNQPNNIVEIAWRIFGEGPYEGNGLLQRLVSSERGALGWNDLMSFRLQCSADRHGQLHNLNSALILNQNPGAKTAGFVDELALAAMRKISQQIFALFKTSYINSQRNFYSEVDAVNDEAFLGDSSGYNLSQISNRSHSNAESPSLSQLASSARHTVKSFVIYQLCNSLPPNGYGIGCGYYDESGMEDGRGIAKRMNDYVFSTCFNPTIEESNIFHFLDHCLSHLSSPLFSDSDDGSYFASKSGIIGGFDENNVALYWKTHQDFIRKKALHAPERRVTTSNYISVYRDDLPGLFDVLDKMVEETTAESMASDYSIESEPPQESR